MQSRIDLAALSQMGPILGRFNLTLGMMLPGLS